MYAMFPPAHDALMVCASIVLKQVMGPGALTGVTTDFFPEKDVEGEPRPERDPSALWGRRRNGPRQIGAGQ